MPSAQPVSRLLPGSIRFLQNRSDAFAPGPGNKWPGRVAINFNKAAVTASGADTTVIKKKMVDDAVCMLTDQNHRGRGVEGGVSVYAIGVFKNRRQGKYPESWNSRRRIGRR